MPRVFLQDVYNGLEPHVQRGEVKAIRVVREMPKTVRIDPSLRAFGFQFPVISCGATYAGKTVLGEVPVEADGSACFRVPAGMPIYFMALDAEGRAVQRMRSFTHLMPGEVQGCVGCHEHRLQTSRPQTGDGLSPCRRRTCTPPEWGAAGFDYSRIVQPVLDQHCVECHNPLDAPKRRRPDRRQDRFLQRLLRRAGPREPGRPRQPVRELDSHLQRPGVEHPGGAAEDLGLAARASWPRSCSPAIRDEDGKPRLQMDEASRRRILAWIDLNVPYYGTSETAYPEKPGCRQILPAGLETVLADVAAAPLRRVPRARARSRAASGCGSPSRS